jgi:hypothetical protein
MRAIVNLIRIVFGHLQLSCKLIITIYARNLNLFPFFNIPVLLFYKTIQFQDLIKKNSYH